VARRTTFGKMQRDREKKAKAAAKEEKRRERLSGGDDDAPTEEPAPVPSGPELSQAEVIERLESLHARFEDGQVSFDDFEEQKAALLARLAVS
jgi:hypothetical protein